jgi:hypothetical protein
MDNQSISVGYVIVAAAERLTDALHHNMPDSIGETSLEELEHLATIFHQAALKLSHKEAEREHAANPRVAAAEIINGWTPVTEDEFNHLGLDETTRRDQKTGAADPRVDRPACITQDEDDDEVPPLTNKERGHKWTIEEDRRINDPNYNIRSKAKNY